MRCGRSSRNSAWRGASARLAAHRGGWLRTEAAGCAQRRLAARRGGWLRTEAAGCAQRRLAAHRGIWLLTSGLCATLTALLESSLPSAAIAHEAPAARVDHAQRRHDRSSPSVSTAAVIDRVFGTRTRTTAVPWNVQVFGRARTSSVQCSRPPNFQIWRTHRTRIRMFEALFAWLTALHV
jgi:hypothetical protein